MPEDAIRTRLDKMVISRDGEIFIETRPSLWEERLSAWRGDHSLPCPIVKGHLMFRRPTDCSCKPYDPQFEVIR
jgi:hypothetical protein